MDKVLEKAEEETMPSSRCEHEEGSRSPNIDRHLVQAAEYRTSSRLRALRTCATTCEADDTRTHEERDARQVRRPNPHDVSSLARSLHSRGS